VMILARVRSELKRFAGPEPQSPASIKIAS
jgi:hypothetical protein